MFLLTLFMIIFSLLFLKSLMINDDYTTMLERKTHESIEDISSEFMNNVSEIHIQKENEK